MIWLYCVTEPGGDPGPELAAAGPEPASHLDHGAVRAWIARPEAPFDTDLESIRAHHAIVEAVWRRTDACLPARFGQTFPDEDALGERLDRRAEHLGRELSRLAGTAEMSVRIVSGGAEHDAEVGTAPAVVEASDAEVGAPGSGPGQAYLRARAEALKLGRRREARAEAVAEELRTWMDGSATVRDARLVVPRPGTGVASVAHLVARDEVPAYREALADFSRAHGGWRLVVGGPWPPWSFGTVGEEAP